MTNFNFFTEPSKTGPNVVSLEFAINTANLWSKAMKVDQLIHYLNSKWASKNLPSPDYLLIELFRIQKYYSSTTFGASKETLDSSGGEWLTGRRIQPADPRQTDADDPGPLLRLSCAQLGGLHVPSLHPLLLNLREYQHMAFLPGKGVNT